MKKFKNLFAVGFALVLSASMFSGCVQQVAQEKTIVMGTNAEFPPFEFIADNNAGIVGEFDGVDVAIAAKIAEKLGCKLVVDNMPFDSLIMNLDAGKIDFIAAGMTVKPEREESVDFSEKYFKAVQHIIVRSDNTDITCMDDLSGKIVGVQLGTTGDFIVTDDIENTQVERYNRGIDAVMSLKSGKIDAIVIDSMPARMFYQDDPSALKIVEDDEAFGDEEYAIAVKKGNKELLDSINAVVREMKANGEIDALVTEYSK